MAVRRQYITQTAHRRLESFDQFPACRGKLLLCQESLWKQVPENGKRDLKIGFSFKLILGHVNLPLFFYFRENQKCYKQKKAARQVLLLTLLLFSCIMILTVFYRMTASNIGQSGIPESVKLSSRNTSSSHSHSCAWQQELQNREDDDCQWFTCTPKKPELRRTLGVFS